MRGKLKIFFGYSAGVGKTFAMLKSAIAAKKMNEDIIIGYLEPHDRPETTELSIGFEKLPLKKINYKGIDLFEFDVDAAIKRNPTTILVDELAHTNVQGSKNRKRYLDVIELINNGINVWTTVNVQHIEGLHDLVGNMTTVDVKERIPDDIFDYADEVVLVDIEPDELIKRMENGKIYQKTQAKLALENFFQNEQLSSLRELYLRRNADRIEKQNNNGKTKTKILALISPSPSAEKNIRIAARMALAYHCKFEALYIEREGILSDDCATNLKKHMRLVRDLGGEMIVKYGDDIVETVADYSRIAGITDLVIGKTWKSIGKKVGLEDRFILRMPDTQIIIVPDNENGLYRTKFLKNYILNLFKSRKRLNKYLITNKTLDIHNTIEREVINNPNKEEVVATILARSFSRSVGVFGKKIALNSWDNEDIDFWNDQNELAVLEWVKNNRKQAGKGTDTLRQAKCLYIPIITNDDIVIVAFSCLKGKFKVSEHMIFAQIESLLQLIL